MILVDTSVWVRHFRDNDEHLRMLLRDGDVLCHAFVVGELACGNLRNRRTILSWLNALPQACMAEHEEVMYLIEHEQLQGRGLGWVDVHLLASAKLTQCTLWTLDKALKQSAKTLQISAERR